jgi:hypothetical protein
MNEVITWLYVGSVQDAEDYTALKEAGIGAVLTLAWPLSHPEDIVVQRGRQPLAHHRHRRVA